MPSTSIWPSTNAIATVPFQSRVARSTSRGSVPRADWRARFVGVL